MAYAQKTSTVGLLISGGLDSCILLVQLLRKGESVQPFYIRTGVVWQEAERNALQNFLAKLAEQVNDRSRLLPLVEFELPIADLYEQHWSTSGDNTPDARSPDEAVFLPGRNALLLIKPSIWCQLHGIRRLALGPLASNPFADASNDFFQTYEQMLAYCGSVELRIERPFATLHKTDVMTLGREAPLQHTWSCIAPRGLLHCGKCNKCAERQAAFGNAGMTDPTEYKSTPSPRN